ncbi:MAG: CHAT domain-containing protein [Stigonema ocellatum SAG 48.90 = DSM 106950]|nr:CHAT domain-containing protein [Stigonema ocellatum SAG 48.90 = DSM 106950]
MVSKKLQKVIKKFIKKIYQKRSLFLAALLFILSTAISPVVAKVSPSTPIIQTQQDAGQLANKAEKLYRIGQLREAATVWEQTAAAFAAQKDRLNQAMALSNLSLTYQQLGQWDKAKKALTDSLELLKTQPQSQEKLKILAQTLDIQGYLQREIGQSGDALNTWQKATTIYSQINAPVKVAQSKINQAEVMQDLGLYPRACKTLLEVLNKELQRAKTCQELNQITPEILTKNLQNLQNEPPSLTVVVGLRSLGDLLRVISQVEQSQIILETSLNLAKKLNSPEEQAATYLSLGKTKQALAEAEKVRELSEQKYPAEATSAYNEVLKLSSSPTMRQQAQLNQLSLLLKLQKLPEAEELWRSLYSQLSNLSPSRTGVYLQINFAQSFIKLAQTENFLSQPNLQLPTFKDIDEILTRATAQAKSLEDQRAKAYALGKHGELYQLPSPLQNLPQAEQFTKDALRIASTFDAPDIAYQYFWQLGRIHKAQGDIKDAIAAYTKAYEALQSLRRDLVALNPEIQFSFRDSVEPVYRELVDLNLQLYASSQTKAVKDEERQKLLTQARQVMESLQLAELNNFFRETCLEANAKQIDKIDPTAAVIYPIILPNRLEVILSLPNQPLKLFTKTIDENKELEKTLDTVQRSLLVPVPEDNSQNFLSSYQLLYDLLIRPMETELANSKVKTLAFVLDGQLQNIPMSILHDGNQYLVEKYSIAVSSGLLLTNPKPLSKINLKALTAGLSEIPDFALKEGFQPLRNVQDEIDQIRKSGISSRPILNNQFTSTQLKKDITDSGFPIVHLATHGYFSSKAEDTFVLSWDRKIDVKQLGDLLRSNVLNQRTPIELLILSACQTATGDKRAALGLAGVAVRSGARSTVATLWSVEDKSTAVIMGKLYQQLEQAKKTQINKAEALRQAQLSLMKDKTYHDPHFWAPFVLVGNWG